MLIVHLFDSYAHTGSGVGCGFCLWLCLDFSVYLFGSANNEGFRGLAPSYYIRINWPLTRLGYTGNKHGFLCITNENTSLKCESLETF